MLKSSHHYLEEQHIKNEVCIRNNFYARRQKEKGVACVRVPLARLFTVSAKWRAQCSQAKKA